MVNQERFLIIISDSRNFHDLLQLEFISRQRSTLSSDHLHSFDYTLCSTSGLLIAICNISQKNIRKASIPQCFTICINVFDTKNRLVEFLISTEVKISTQIMQSRLNSVFQILLPFRKLKTKMPFNYNFSNRHSTNRC